MANSGIRKPRKFGDWRTSMNGSERGKANSKPQVAGSIPVPLVAPTRTLFDWPPAVVMAIVGVARGTLTHTARANAKKLF